MEKQTETSAPAVSLSTGTDPVTGATIISDKDDYAPGEIVHITGHGWAPGELVQLEMTEDLQVHEVITAEVTADDSGSFSLHFYDVNEHDLGATFTFTATGAKSGAVATMTFTDANLQSAALTMKAADCGVNQTTFNVNDAVCVSALTTVVGNATPVETMALILIRPNGSVASSTVYPTVVNGSTYTHQGTVDVAGTWTAIACRQFAPGSTQCTPAVPLPGNIKGTTTFTVGAAPTNTAPVLSAIGPKSGNELTNITFDADATDDGLPTPATLTFSLGTPACANQVPAAATIDPATGVFSWTPTAADAGKVFCARVVVSDGVLTDFEDVTITVIDVNAPPVLSALNSKTADEGLTITFTATATDDGLPAPPTLTFTLDKTACNGKTALPAAASITSGGAFSWATTEVDGPGVYCASVVVSDGQLTDTKTVEITVKEVNLPPELVTVPSSASTPWGSPVNDFQLTATDPDLPANTLTFSKVSGPSWVSVSSSGLITYGPIPSSAIGVQTIVVKVSDGELRDSHSYTITVGKRATALVYTGKTSGQYSDKSTLSATLTDASPGALNTAPIAGATISFTFGGAAAGSGLTSSIGTASVAYQVLAPAGTPDVVSTFAATTIYDGATDTDVFTVAKENAVITNVSIGNGGSIPVAQTSFTVTASVREALTAGVEPNPPDQQQQQPGNVALTTLGAQITGLGSNTSYTGNCVVTTAGSTSYASAQAFTCTFSGGPFVVDAYSLTLSVPTANGYWQAVSYEDALAVWDPNAGFATGGGRFELDGDRVSFGFSYTLQKGKTVPRSGFVVVRHMADGGVCRVKSNNAMNAPAVVGNTATLSGKGNYSCVDANGVTKPGESAGNISIAAYAEDNATSGAGFDKFGVANGAPVATNYLKMATPFGGSGGSAKLLTGGNVQVPQPNK